MNSSINTLNSPFHLFDKLYKSTSEKEGLTASPESSCEAKPATTTPPRPPPKFNPIPTIIACSICSIGIMYFLWYVFIIQSISDYPKIAYSVGIIFTIVAVQIALITMIGSKTEFISTDKYINTLICCVAIMVPTFIMINSIPSLSGIYENTFGVWILQLLYPPVNDIIGAFYKNNVTSTSNNKNTILDASFKLLTWNIVKDKDQKGIGEFLNSKIVGDNFTTETGTGTRTENIKSLILKKNLIGNFIWMSSASVISILMCAYSK
jgi:hypothetical protein